jgi:glycerol-1-phosphate dehydrogenase [NAD(P)+]
MSLLERFQRPNVKQLEWGRGLIEGLGERCGRYVVTTMPVPWELVRARIGPPPLQVIHVENMELAAVQAAEAGAPPCETVVAIGGGQAMDMGKYIAWKRGCRLINVPTIVSTNAYVTATVGVREQGRVSYIGEVTPDLLLVDFDLIRTAPPELNIAGCGDILSIHTASFDWELAAAAGQEPRGYDAGAVARGRALVRRLAEGAEEIRALSDDGLRLIVECYLEINDICLPLGHYRVEEGSEHFFAYNVEYLTGRTYVHGWLVGLGIWIMSRLQQNEAETITSIMERIGLPHTPCINGLTRADVEQALTTLQARTVADERWYSIIQQRPPTPAFIAETLRLLEERGAF